MQLTFVLRENVINPEQVVGKFPNVCWTSTTDSYTLLYTLWDDVINQDVMFLSFLIQCNNNGYIVVNDRKWKALPFSEPASISRLRVFSSFT